MKSKNKEHCDYRGECKNKAHREVYQCMLAGAKEDVGWSYLCRKHFTHEVKKLRGKLPYCTLD